MTLISSPSNARIKAVVKLTKRRVRDGEQKTVVEGAREVHRALASGVQPVDAFVCLPLIQQEDARTALAALEQLSAAGRVTLSEVTPDVFAKVAYRGDSGGLLMTIPYVSRTLAQLPLGPQPFLAVIEGVEKPGNLGAILRTADAAGVDGVIVCAAPSQSATDIHNPNAIRASLGTLFSVPVVEATTAATIEWLREHDISIVAATPHAATLFTDVNMTGPVAVAMGSEADGLSPSLLAAAAAQVRIPMHGLADSLNLATSTALLLYEVVRQRPPRR